MSIKRMTAVWEYSQHKGSALLLMLSIADNANDIGVAWPGYEYLARKTRMSRRSVMRLARSCEDSGELWILHRERQKSNVSIVTIGLSLAELEKAAIQAAKMGAVPPTGSDILTPPTQVLVVVNRLQIVPKCHQVVIPGAPRSDTAMSPDPSLPVINTSGTAIEPPTTSEVDAAVLEQVHKIGVNGKKANDLVRAYTENGELAELVPRLSEWLIYLDKQPGVTNPIGLAITKTENRMDPPEAAKDDYWRNFVENQDRRRYIEGKYADIIEH